MIFIIRDNSMRDDGLGRGVDYEYNLNILNENHLWELWEENREK